MSVRPVKRKYESSDDEEENKRASSNRCKFYDIIVDRMAATQGTRQGTGTATFVALEKLAHAMGLTGVHLRCVHSPSGQGLIGKLVREYKWVPNGQIVPTGTPTEPIYFYRGLHHNRVPIQVRSQETLHEMVQEDRALTQEEEEEDTQCYNMGVIQCESLQDVAIWIGHVMDGKKPNEATTFLIADNFKIQIKLSRAPRMRAEDFVMSCSLGKATDVLSPYLQPQSKVE